MTYRSFVTATAALGWCALALQSYLTVTLSLSNGRTLAGAIVFLFSFFTVLTNAIAALSLSIIAGSPSSRWGRWLARPAMQSGIAAAMALVGIAYELLLRQLWNPTGLQFLADLLLHDVMPLLYLLYWAIFVPKGSLKWLDVLWWLSYPAGYLTYALARGALSGQYPYPFLDVGILGYGRMAINSAALLIGFVCIGLALVTIDRGLPRWRGISRGVCR